MIKEIQQTLAFDGSSKQRGGGARVASYVIDGSDVSLSFKLDFPFSNNKDEYDTKS